MVTTDACLMTHSVELNQHIFVVKNHTCLLAESIFKQMLALAYQAYIFFWADLRK